MNLDIIFIVFLGKRKKSIDGKNPSDFTGMYILCCIYSFSF